MLLDCGHFHHPRLEFNAKMYHCLGWEQCGLYRRLNCQGVQHDKERTLARTMGRFIAASALVFVVEYSLNIRKGHSLRIHSQVLIMSICLVR